HTPCDHTRSRVGDMRMAHEIARRRGLPLTILLLWVFLPVSGSAEQVDKGRRGDTQATGMTAVPRESQDNGDFATRRVTRVVETLRFLRTRVVQDDRLQTAAGALGIGIAAYEARRDGGSLPLGAIGGEALRLGFHRPLTSIERRSGFVVEPSLGRRSFAVT